MDGSELKASLKTVISDIKRLTQKNHLILYFTRQEIETLYLTLDELKHVVSYQPDGIADCLDTLRPLVRSYWIINRSPKETEQIQECEEALINPNEDLGREFQAKSESLQFKFWLILSGLCVFMAVAFAFVFTADEMKVFGISLTHQNDPWDKISHLSIISLFVSTAVFCAKQYIKNERIREIYDHKKVISASLPSFREQMESHDAVKTQYLAKTINELHEHPLDILDRKSEKKGKTEDSKDS